MHNGVLVYILIILSFRFDQFSLLLVQFYHLLILLVTNSLHNTLVFLQNPVNHHILALSNSIVRSSTINKKDVGGEHVHFIMINQLFILFGIDPSKHKIIIVSVAEICCNPLIHRHVPKTVIAPGIMELYHNVGELL